MQKEQFPEVHAANVRRSSCKGANVRKAETEAGIW
jgi:hypothetical protein